MHLVPITSNPAAEIILEQHQPLPDNHPSSKVKTRALVDTQKKVIRMNQDLVHPLDEYGRSQPATRETDSLKRMPNRWRYFEHAHLTTDVDGNILLSGREVFFNYFWPDGEFVVPLTDAHREFYHIQPNNIHESMLGGRFYLIGYVQLKEAITHEEIVNGYLLR